MYDLYDFQFQDRDFTTFTLLRQAWIAGNRAMEHRLAKAGLTPEKLAVLWACRDYPGALTTSELSRLLFREPQSIVGLLNRMEMDGLIKRIPKRKGKPFTEIKMAAKGEEAIGPALPIHKALIAELASNLSAEQQEQLQDLLRTLRNNALEKLHLESGPPPGFSKEELVDVKW